MYTIWNDTDDISASPLKFKTTQEANDEIKRIRKAFLDHQGYYFTANRDRIHPDDVEYRVVPQARGAAIRKRNIDPELV